MLAACATSSSPASGAARAVMANDGSVELHVRNPGLFARDEVVSIKPGEAGYDAMKDGVETVQTTKRRPVLTWTIGEPTYLP